MIKCPLCQSTDTKVRHSRTKDECVVRYRRCKNCGSNFKTKERVDMEIIWKEVAREIFGANIRPDLP